MAKVLLDGAVLADSVSPVLLNDYLLEQMARPGWRLLCAGYEPDGTRRIEMRDAAGALRVFEVAA